MDGLREAMELLFMILHISRFLNFRHVEVERVADEGNVAKTL